MDAARIPELKHARSSKTPFLTHVSLRYKAIVDVLALDLVEQKVTFAYSPR